MALGGTGPTVTRNASAEEVARFDKLAEDGVPFRISMTMTPPLVQMLRDELLQNRYSRELDKLCELADKEAHRTRNQDPRFHKMARFYQHHGFDWHAIQLAAQQDMEGGRMRGGSTLTQQLVKNIFFGTGRSILRKAAQASLEVYKLNLAFCSVTSPVDGMVARYYLTLGNLVNQDQTLLTTVVSLDPMYAYFDMDERTLLQIRTALSGGGDKTIRLWDLNTARELRRMKGHSEGVSSVVFSPDGRQALSSSSDKTIRLWDVATGRTITVLEGHAEGVRFVAFSPDSKHLASAGKDHVVKIWEVETGKVETTRRRI